MIQAMFVRLKRLLSLRTRLLLFQRFLPKVGRSAAIRLALRKADSDLWIQPSGIGSKMLVRGNSSDIYAFIQIFVEEEYLCLSDIELTGLIIDAGANVGYSSIYFLSRFPLCNIVAIEPDPRNFETLSRNLAAYGDRVTLCNSALWSHRTCLSLEATPYRDGSEYTRQVRKSSDGQSVTIHSMTVDDVMKQACCDRVALLKVDIEGAEAVVFGPGATTDWLDKVDAIVIELHDDSQFGNASQAFYTAIEGRGFQVSHSGELTVCLRAYIPSH